MLWLSIIGLGVVLVLLVVLILQNTQEVKVSFLWWEGTPPLAAALLIAAAGGIAADRYRRLPADPPAAPAGEAPVSPARRPRSPSTASASSLEVVGWTLVLAGIAALVLPGPGLLGIFAGLAILSQQYEWAERRVEPIKKRALEGASDSVQTWPRIVVADACALGIVAFGVFWLLQPAAPSWWPVDDKWWLFGGWPPGITLVLSGLFALGHDRLQLPPLPRHPLRGGLVVSPTSRRRSSPPARASAARWRAAAPARGTTLALVGVHEEALADLAAELEQLGATVRHGVADITDAAAATEAVAGWPRVSAGSTCCTSTPAPSARRTRSR